MFGLNTPESKENYQPIKDVKNIELPKLNGKHLEEHFLNIGIEQTNKYLKLLSSFNNGSIPKMPDKFEFKAGWTK